MKRMHAFITMLVVLALVLAGCGSKKGDAIQDAAANDAAAAQSEESTAQDDAAAQDDTTARDEHEQDAAPAQEGTAETSDDPAADDARDSTEDTPSANDANAPPIDEDGTYTSKEDVALYLHTYGHLPSNYVTKDEAEDAGWKTEGLDLSEACPGMSIGGDRFGNREGLLPKAKGRAYYECDIDYPGRGSRNAKRIVYSNDGLIYYTEDHYQTFELLYGEES